MSVEMRVQKLLDVVGLGTFFEVAPSL